MAQEILISGICAQCNGTGNMQHYTDENPNGQVECTWPGCNGTGFIPLGKVVLDPGLNDVMDKCNDILDKCADILENLT